MAKKFKMPSSFTILAALIVIMAIMTWIIPAGRYDTTGDDNNIAVKGTYKSADDRVKIAEIEYEKVKVAEGIVNEDSEAAKNNKAFQTAKTDLESAKAIKDPQGIWEILMSPTKGLRETVGIMIVVLFVGGLLAIEAKVGAIQAGFKVLVNKMRGKEKWMFPVLITVLALCGSAYGSQEETVVYYAFMVPLMLAAGYNAMTALMTVIVGTSVGIAASTVNPFSSLLAADLGGSTADKGMLLRVIMLIAGIIIGSIFVMRYAEKVKAGKYAEDSVNDSKLKFAKDVSNAGEFDAKRKATLVIIFMALVGITVLGFIPWETLGINWFNDASEWLAGTPILGELIGNVTPFGNWWFDELSVVYLTAALLIGVLYKMGDKEFADTFIEGAKDVLGVILIIGVARAITVIMNDGNITHTILHSLEVAISSLPEGLSKGLFGGVLYLIYLPLAFLIPSTSGLASVSMPIFGPLADLTGVGAHIAVAAFVAGSGIMQMVAPTVGTLMGSAAVCGVSYTKYLKRVGKLFLVLSIAYIIIITIASVTGFSY